MGEHLRDAFARVARLEDGEIDLARAALLVAANEYPGLDIDHELGTLDSLAVGAADRMGGDRDPLYELNVLSEYLFDELGFAGNEQDYYDPRNSFINDVLSRRLGIPITLSLVYIEVGKRLGMPLVGLGMPGHFLVGHVDVEDLFVDTFNGGILLSEEECARRLQESTRRTTHWNRALLDPVGNKEFMARLLRNLKAIYMQRQDNARALNITDWLVILQPEAPEERRDRGLVNYYLGNRPEALADLSAYLDSAGDERDVAVVEGLVSRIRKLLDD